MIKITISSISFIIILLNLSIFNSYGSPISKCIPTESFAISGLTHGDPAQMVIQKLGNPIKKDPWGEKIDGEFKAIYNTETWIYRNIKIDITNGHILSISTISSECSTPNGIRPGLTKLDVLRILKMPLDAAVKKEKEIQIANCGPEAYLVLIFNDQNILERLELGIDLP